VSYAKQHHRRPQIAPAAGAIEEVVVTAEKRESTVQKTPISITAISGADYDVFIIAGLLAAGCSLLTLMLPRGLSPGTSASAR